MSAPNIVLSFACCAACSSVMPLALRASYKILAYSAVFSEVSGSTSVMPVRSTPGATLLASSSLPMSTILAIPSLVICAAASTTRLSSPSQRTSVFLRDAAFALISSSNAMLKFLLKTLYLSTFLIYNACTRYLIPLYRLLLYNKILQL